MLKLALLFILVPVAELFLLIEMGRYIGLVSTLALIAFTGLLGAWLARRQGLGVLARVREEMATGSLPADAATDGIIILLAGAVLMTPGILTDAFGFFCLVPAGRRILKRAVKAWFARTVDAGTVQFRMTVDGMEQPAQSRPMRDITPRHSGQRSADDNHNLPE